MDFERDIKFYTDVWERGYPPPKWQEIAANCYLAKYFNQLKGDRTKLRVLLPCCGNSLDIKWMLDQGMEVVGIEYCEIPIKKFFTENNIDFTKEPLKNIEGYIYKGTNAPVTIYQCDIMKFKEESQEKFEAIYDRGALTVMRDENRIRYFELLKSWMTPTSKFLLVFYEYDGSVFTGRPFNANYEEVKNLFGNGYNVELLERDDTCEEYKNFCEPLGMCYCVTLLCSLKTC